VSDLFIAVIVGRVDPAAQADRYAPSLEGTPKRTPR
jgi:hypothetical protein